MIKRMSFKKTIGNPYQILKEVNRLNVAVEPCYLLKYFKKFSS